MKIFKENESILRENNNRIFEIEEELNTIVYKLFDLDEESIKVIEDYYDKKYKNDLEINKTFDIGEFTNEHINNNLGLFDISKKYGVHYKHVIELRRQYKNNEKVIVSDLYNYLSLYNSIDTYFIRLIRENLHNNKKYLAINECVTLLEERVSNFDEYVDVLRNRTAKNIKKPDIIKDCVSKDTYTWSAYRKAKNEEKINKSFTRYYDNDYYGLSEWSDEIHKHYFLDAIEEHTVNSPNEKKAKDVLKLFKELDIQDKQDYIEIIEGKIKRAFH